MTIRNVFLYGELLASDKGSWYLNESSIHVEFEYVTIIMIQESIGISVFGAGRVKFDRYGRSGMWKVRDQPFKTFHMDY